MEQADSLTVSTQTLTDYDERETYLQQIQKHKDSMAVYTNRVNSFAHYVQSPYSARGSEFALAGFHFIGRPDKVRCFACGLTLSHWQISDLPLNEHIRYMPKRRMLKVEMCKNLNP